MEAVMMSRWLVKGAMGGSPRMMFVSMMLAKHISIVENQLASGCLRESTCESYRPNTNTRLDGGLISLSVGH